MTHEIETTLATTHPYDTLPEDVRATLSLDIDTVHAAAGDVIYTKGEDLTHLYLIMSGRIDITDEGGEILSILGPRNSFGERGLMKDGKGAVTATAAQDSRLLAIPAQVPARQATAQWVGRSR
jgi:CBS domain-containing protein